MRKLCSCWKYSPSLTSLRSKIVIYILHLQKIPCVWHCWCAFVSGCDIWGICWSSTPGKTISTWSEIYYVNQRGSDLSRIKEFLSAGIVTEKTENFLQISCSSSKESQDKLRSTHNCLEEDEGLNEIVYLVFEPTGTNMEGYWILFLVMTDLLIQNIRTCHFRNLSEYLSLIYELLQHLISYKDSNYGRWLLDFWASIASLPEKKIQILCRKFHSDFNKSTQFIPRYGLVDWVHYELGFNIK